MKKTIFKPTLLTYLAAGMLFVAMGCGGGSNDDAAVIDTTGTDTTGAIGMVEDSTATVNIEPTPGNEARGTLTFTKDGEGVRIAGQISGLKGTSHGMHIHEVGDCGNNAENAKGHFNPTGTPHGAPDLPADQRHVGDFGNVTADANGTATIDLTMSPLAFAGAGGILGRAVVVHGGQDDLKTQPSGNSGPRIGCGIIQGSDGVVASPATTATGTDTTGHGGTTH